MYSIGKRVGSGIIAVSGEVLMLDTVVAATDVAEYTELIRGGQISEAGVILERGFLSILPEVPSDAYLAWVSTRTSFYRALLRERAAAVWVEASNANRWPVAATATRLLLNLDPDDERALRGAIETRVMAGRVQEAEAVYAAFLERARAKHDSTWEPSQETVSLLDRVRRLQGPVQTGSRLRESRDHPRLVGRDAESARLARSLSPSASGPLNVVLLTGEAGIGKSRLARASLIGLPLRGRRVLEATCGELEQSIPLNPLLDALSREWVGHALAHLSDPWRAVLRIQLPQFHAAGMPEAIPAVEPGSIPRRLFEAFLQLFRRLVDSGPVVMFIDDFHWVDETSVAVLEYIRRRWNEGRLTLLLALRPECLDPRGPIQRFLLELDPRASVKIPIAELSEPAACELVAAVGGQVIDANRAAEIASLAGNNPFFIVELTVEHLAGRLPRRPGIGDLLPLPLSVRQVLERRLEALSPTAVQVLNAATVAGAPMTPQLLADIIGRSVTACLAAVEELDGLRLIVSHQKEVQVRHELIRQAVYGRMSKIRRAWLHERIAQLLERSGETDAPGEIAIHYDRAAVTAQAYRFAVLAADRAEQAGATPETIRFLGIARRNTDDADAAATIVQRLGQLHYLQRNLADAGPLLALASERLSSLGRNREAIRAEVELLDVASQREALPVRDLITDLRRAKERATAAGYWDVVAKALDVEVHMLDRLGDRTAMRSAVHETLRVANRVDASTKASLLSTVCIPLLLYESRAADAIACALRAVRIALESEASEVALRAVARAMVVFMYQGLLDKPDGIELVETGQALAARSGDVFQKFNITANLGVWYLDTGRLDQAKVTFDRASDILGSSEAIYLQLALHCNQGELAFSMQATERARREFLAARALWMSTHGRYFKGLIHAGLGLCALHDGQLRNARDEEAQVPTQWNVWPSDPSLITIFRARMLERRGNPRDAVALLDDVATTVESVLPVHALKIRREQIRMEAKHGCGSPTDSTAKAIAKATELGLEALTALLLGAGQGWP